MIKICFRLINCSRISHLGYQYHGHDIDLLGYLISRFKCIYVIWYMLYELTKDTKGGI